MIQEQYEENVKRNVLSKLKSPAIQVYSKEEQKYNLTLS
jgi:hypothetical protein